MTLEEQATTLRERFRNLEAMAADVSAAKPLLLALQNGRVAVDVFTVLLDVHAKAARVVQLLERFGAVPAGAGGALLANDVSFERLLIQLRERVAACECAVAEAAQSE
jgi:hypothetical protein